MHVKNHYHDAKEKLRKLLNEYNAYERKREKIFREIYAQIKVSNERVETYEKKVNGFKY